MTSVSNRFNVVKAIALAPDTQVMQVLERTHLYTLEQALDIITTEGFKAPLFTVKFHKSGDKVMAFPHKLVLL